MEFGEKLGKKFLTELSRSHAPIVLELIGDVGAGKTTLTRGIAKGLGVKNPVTSPSFTISKQYAFSGGTLVHYDFYRLPDPGLMTEDLNESVNAKDTVTVVEWGQSAAEVLPENRTIYNIYVLDDGAREVKEDA